MATVLRYVDGAGVGRLNLNDPTGFQLGQGFDVGIPELKRGELSQPGVDGELYYGESLGNPMMRVPITLRKQPSAAAMKVLMDALTTELNRTTNIIEYKPEGWPTTYFLDTYRVAPTAIHRGEEGQSPFVLLRDNAPIVLFIRRVVRAGATVAGARTLYPV